MTEEDIKYRQGRRKEQVEASYRSKHFPILIMLIILLLMG